MYSMSWASLSAHDSSLVIRVWAKPVTPGRTTSRCQYCGHKFQTRDLNLDHVTPLSRGGKSTWENVVCCCIGCNSRKGGHRPEEVGMRLVRAPTKPRWHPLVKISFTSGKYEAWRNFLDVAYWNAELRED